MRLGSGDRLGDGGEVQQRRSGPCFGCRGKPAVANLGSPTSGALQLWQWNRV